MTAINVTGFSAEEKAAVERAAEKSPLRQQNTFCRVAILEKVARDEAERRHLKSSTPVKAGAEA